ncbi:DUF1553 domain-containing protein [Telmatocola sphagniphila]|uniref:DUF1553 domain-containing protein n=1 Tax=Telmatocola sphagniphila TaxID=1123043 RepID=A0A8E6B3K9_9BACT|nr:DUF1553 domain-containing protein [Telmatocola sphagniphila]QVL30707.1 DUF1553 domain-containing protein [Telmatocola sphagniphila]
MRQLLTVLFFGLSAVQVLAADLRILPSEVTLTGPGASQKLLIVEEEKGRVIAEKTAGVTLVSSNTKVAVIDKGTLQAVGNGNVIVTAKTSDGKTATAKVLVLKAEQNAPPSFRNDIIPILTRAGCNSGSCHGALAGKGGLKLSLRGYDPESDHFVLTRQALARRVDRSQPEKSLVLLKGARLMPHGGGQRLFADEADYNTLLTWIQSGALLNPVDAKLDRIEVLPRAALLSPQAKSSLIVRAFYSDGQIKDVTRWCHYGSSDDNVAKVTEEALVSGAGYGEASITVGFGSRVTTMVITSPFPNSVNPKVFADSPRSNFIDELVLQKLQSLNLPPSPNCKDAEFIRRAFLDATGILPQPQEVEKFISDKSVDKRAKLIAELLERPELIDYWSYKWSDLFLVSTRKLPQPAMWSFYRSLRQAVADNKPWDQLARDILLANGSTMQNGGGNFFVLHKDTSDVAETVAVSFLGMSVTCARCHNHPLEKWTQDQYWSFANLFSRVGLKNGERDGDVVVFERPTGDVLHPRRGVPMPAAPLDGLPLAAEEGRDRRIYFADWLTSPDNPYFAKALVNRVWRNFMGRGLVEAEDDLRETNPASNRELLDALARDFITHKFDVKVLIRTIMNSAAYQRSSQKLEENAQDDRYYSRYLVRRLPGEVILDALSQVTGSPTPFKEIYTGVEGGVAATSNYPPGTRALQLPDSRVASRFLDAFGRPDRLATCSCERQQDPTVGQALMMNNGQTLNDKLRAPDSRVSAWLKEKVTDEQAISRIFMLALSRPPSAKERERFQAIFANKTSSEPNAPGRREALEDLFWAVLTSREFLFNH